MTARRTYHRLRDLLDVLVSSPADGEVLTYSSAASKWENQAGGGGSPAGSDGQIQFNDGDTALGASPDLVWDDTAKILYIRAAENGIAQITANGSGVQVQINAADGGADNPGGEIGISAGNSFFGNGGGEVAIQAGNDAGGGDGGDITIASGSSTGADAWDGGDIAIRANPDAPAGNNGGDINVVAGQGVHGGNVTIQGGGTSGNVQVYSGDGNQALQLDNTGLNVIANVGFYGAAPVAQPTGVAVSAVAIHAALVSLGLITA